MLKLTVELNCGETTCYVARDVHCRFLRTGRFGSMWYCQLFGDKELLDVEEQLMRLPECLEATNCFKGDDSHDH